MLKYVMYLLIFSQQELCWALEYLVVDDTIQSNHVISNSLISNYHLSRITAYLEVKIWSLF